MSKKAELRRLEAENASLAAELSKARERRLDLAAENTRLKARLRMQQRPWWEKARDACGEALGDLLDRWGIGW